MILPMTFDNEKFLDAKKMLEFNRNEMEIKWEGVGVSDLPRQRRFRRPPFVGGGATESTTTCDPPI